MPLWQDDQSLDYDGSWDDATRGWPCINFDTEQEARRAHHAAWRDANVPYGSYVLVGSELRLETEEQKARVLEVLRRSDGPDEPRGAP